MNVETELASGLGLAIVYDKTRPRCIQLLIVCLVISIEWGGLVQ